MHTHTEKPSPAAPQRQKLLYLPSFFLFFVQFEKVMIRGSGEDTSTSSSFFYFCLHYCCSVFLSCTLQRSPGQRRRSSSLDFLLMMQFLWVALFSECALPRLCSSSSPSSVYSNWKHNITSCAVEDCFSSLKPNGRQVFTALPKFCLEFMAFCFLTQIATPATC